MNETSTESLVTDEDEKVIISASGKKYRRIHQDLLDNMPQDLVREMARRRLADLMIYKSNLQVESL